jgi:methyltransferase family protein
MVLVLDEKQSAWLSRMREDWHRVMKPLSTTEGWGNQFVKRGKAFLPIPVLEPHHVSNAKLVPSREALLESLPKGGVIGEIGTGHGDFAKKIYDVIRPLELHLFDITFQQFELAKLLCATDVVTKHQGDSATNLCTFPNEYFDWLYIDADHSYEGVKRDIEQAVQKIKTSGFLIFNDFTFWSPLEAMSYGVAHAVCELCLSRDWEIFYFTLEPLMYCDVAVRPRSR